jgi:hypothetical protein
MFKQRKQDQSMSLTCQAGHGAPQVAVAAGAWTLLLLACGRGMASAEGLRAHAQPVCDGV